MTTAAQKMRQLHPPGPAVLSRGEDVKEGRSAKPKILVVDDENSARSGLVELLRDEGNSVRGAADGFKALGVTEDWTPDLVITDVHMPGMDGIELMGKLQARFPGMGVIVMTAFSTVERAVEAMRLGADDYLTKPIRLDELLIVSERILQHRRVLAELERLRQVVADVPSDNGGWVGRSARARDVMRLLSQVADSPAPVLITGEAGTGKAFAAQTLHQTSARRDAPLVEVHCAGLSEALLTAEIFGHEAGAVDGLPGEGEGRLAKADGGSLLLAEIVDLPSAIQLRVLRFLQDGEYERVGSEEVRSADVRIVAATDRDLAEAVKAGRFREDLFYRLSVITLRLPTLRERRDDIPVLAAHFLRRQTIRNRKDVRAISDRALETLQAFDWPGNVSQLESCIERAVIMCNEMEIEPRHLPREVLGLQRDPRDMPIVPGATMAELEQYAILQTLEAVSGSTSRAAKMLGISTRTVQYRMNEYRDKNPSGVPAVQRRPD